MLDVTNTLKTLATKWATKHPQHIDRITRGLALALSSKVAPRGVDSWRVCGSAKGSEYLVEVNCGFPSCTCPDFIRNARRETPLRCKHIWAAALLTVLASKLEAALPKPDPKPPTKPLTRALGDHCKKLHAENHRAVRSLSLVRGFSES